MKRTFDKDFLVDELGLPYEDGDNIQSDYIVDTTRWSEIHDLIFKYEDKFYQTSYSVGATECQDERPWEYDDEVECTEVHKVSVQMSVWKPVEVEDSSKSTVEEIVYDD